MHIIAICAQKGGVSKTTISQCLSIEALKEGRRAVIVDMDPQGSCAKWGQRREAKGIPVPAVIHARERPMYVIIEELRSKQVAAVFIHPPALVTPPLNAALRVSTASLLPTRPNPLDVDALVATWAIVRRFPTLRAAALITQAPPGGRAKALGLAMERLKKLDIPTCATAL